MKLNPIIKWTGSKRHVMSKLTQYFPPEYSTFFDPFVGGGNSLPWIKGPKVAGDILDNIEVFKLLQLDSEKVIEDYTYRHARLQTEGKDYYYLVRDEFNQSRNPLAFLFLTRNCTNGLIRFNSKGLFNSSIHFNRNGITPANFAKTVASWQATLNSTEFLREDYRETLSKATEKDFVFFDPPYFNSKAMYGPIKFNFEEFYIELDRLNKIGAKWLLTLGENDSIPVDLYKTKIIQEAGLSAFRKIAFKNLVTISDAVYCNYETNT